MPRVHTVQRSRKAQKCGSCDEPIPAGSPYRWWKGRYGPKRFRCMKEECRPRRSHLTSSDKLARIFEAEEALEELAHDAGLDLGSGDIAAAVARLQDGIEEPVSSAREVADEYREAADAWEHGHEEHETRADDAESWADELEQVQDTITGLDTESTAEDVEEALGELHQALGACPF